MAYCRSCGKEIADNAAYCPACGAQQMVFEQPAAPQQVEFEPAAPQPAPDSGSFGWAVLGFFIPIVGLILFLVWKDQKPLSAKSAGIGALVSAIIAVVGYIILFAVGMNNPLLYY